MQSAALILGFVLKTRGYFCTRDMRPSATPLVAFSKIHCVFLATSPLPVRRGSNSSDTTMLLKHPFFPPKLTTSATASSRSTASTAATIGSRFVSFCSSAAAVPSAFAFHNSLHNSNNNNKNMIEFPHLIFGYGSLLCPESRRRTAPTVADRVVLPVSIQGIERRWDKASPTMRTTSLGVEFCGDEEDPSDENTYNHDESDTDDSHSSSSSSSSSRSSNDSSSSSSRGCIGILLPVTTPKSTN